MRISTVRNLGRTRPATGPRTAQSVDDLAASGSRPEEHLTTRACTSQMANFARVQRKPAWDGCHVFTLKKCHVWSREALLTAINWDNIYCSFHVPNKYITIIPAPDCPARVDLSFITENNDGLLTKIKNATRCGSHHTWMWIAICLSCYHA